MSTDTRRNLFGRLAAIGFTAPAMAAVAPQEQVYSLTAAEMEVIERAIEAFARTHEMARVYNEACRHFLQGDLTAGCRALATLESVNGRAPA